MKTFFEQLDRKAGRWLNAVDEQLQAPLVNTLTGEVFTHDTAADQDDQVLFPTVVRQSNTPASRHVHESRAADTTKLYPPLRKADARSDA